MKSSTASVNCDFDASVIGCDSQPVKKIMFDEDDENKKISADDNPVIITAEEIKPPFSWTLNKEICGKSIFEKKKCVEYAPPKKVFGFIANEMGISYAGLKRYEGISHKTELDQINQYKELYDAKKKIFKTAHHLPKHKWGRITPTNHLSLCVFHRPTRHGLSKDIYDDFDMENAQPSFISDICKQHGISTPQLNYYVENTKEIRTAIMQHHNCTKETAKLLPIRLLFGGKYKTWLIDENIDKNDKILLKEIVEMEKEISSIMEIVFNSNPQILKDVERHNPKQWKTLDDKKRGVMALWGQTIERLIQECCISHLVDNKSIKLETIVPCQDGFMIKKSLSFNGIEGLLETVVKDKLNLTVKWANKPFDEALEIPDSTETKTYDEWMDLLSVKKLADTFLSHFGDFICNDESKMFVYWENRWYNECDDSKRYKFTRYISESLYEIMKKQLDKATELKDGDINKLCLILRTNTSRRCHINDIAIHVMSKAEPPAEKFDSKPFLLGFENGVYDLMADEFRDYNYNDYMTLSTGYDYEKPDYNNKDTADKRDTLNKIFEDIQPDPDRRLFYYKILASGLDGVNYQQIQIFNGKGGNGKSLTAKFQKSALGKDYYFQPSDSMLKEIAKSNAPSPDIYNLKNKRYLCFTEVKGRINVAVLRKLSGGNEFNGRLLQCNPETFTLSSMAVIECNNDPEFDGQPTDADYRRNRYIDYVNTFTDDKTKIGTMNKNGGKYIMSNVSYVDDPNFITGMRAVYLDFLLNIYRLYKTSGGLAFSVPECIRKRTEVFLNKQNLFNTLFNALFEKVEDKNNTLKLKLMWDAVQSSESYRELNYIDKRTYSRDKFYEFIDDGFIVELDKNKTKVVCGVKYIEFIEEVKKEENSDNLTEKY